MRKIYLSILSGLLFTSAGYGQVTVTNPTNTTPNLAATYTSLAFAINALDAITAISGPVTITLNAGNPETAPVGGYVIQFSATTTAVNNITISGSNNTITASGALVAGRFYDGIFKIIGADYITLQNFTMQENPANTTTAAGTNNMTEWGVALLHASVTDGAQNNTIQNNTISLNRTYQNTFGIYSNGRHSATVVTVTENITSVTGSNFGNKVYGNNISNVGYGIVFVGSSTPAFMDDGNDIGGSSLATGNTITNWGGISTAITGYISVTGSSFCIYANHQVNENISYNTITSATVTGATFTFGGILKAYGTAQPSGTITSAINNNTITLSSTNASGAMDGILSQNLTALSTATFTISNNLISNCLINGAGTSSAFSGIINSSAPGVLNITNNIIRGLSSTSVTGGYTGISNTGAVVTTINITNNKIGDAISGAATFSNAFTTAVNCIINIGGASTATVNINNNSIDGLSIVTSGQATFIQNQAASAVAVNMNNNQLGSVTGILMTFSGSQSSDMFFIYNGGATATTAVSISGNDIRGVTHALTGTGQHQYIRSNAAGLTLTMSNNTFTNLSDNISTNSYLLMDVPSMAAGATTLIDNNSIVTGYSKTAPGGIVYFIYCIGSSVNGSTSTVTNNSFTNVSVTGATALYCIFHSDGVSFSNGPTKTITGNTINNITGGSDAIYGIYPDHSAGLTCTSNTISNITGSGDITGIYTGPNNGQGTFTYSSNSISTFISSGSGGDVYGITGGSSLIPAANIYSNTISGFSSSKATGIITGIQTLGSQTVNIYDNIINTFTGTGTGSVTASGITVYSTPTLNIYRNKIYSLAENGATSTTSPAVNGIRFVFGGGSNNVYNNFISDLKAPNANLTDAIRGINFESATANTSCNLYYNSIYLNATSTGTNFGTSGIYHTTSGTSSTGTLNMIDNIIVNTSTPNGTGVTAAYRRSDATLTNFAATSDYNLFYAGTPSANRLIYYDGTNSDQTLAAYKTRVSARDANSISLLPTFTSTTDLHLTTANCQLNGRGTPVAGITDDIDAAVRNVTAPDIGADEFTGLTSTALAGVVGSTVCETRTVSATGTSYMTNACELIAKVFPNGVTPVSGNINSCVTLKATTQFFNAEPYVKRYIDVEPNATATTARITLYLLQSEFDDYNTNNGLMPDLPSSPADAVGISNVRVTQSHGVPTQYAPGYYPGTSQIINPADPDIIWNVAKSWWEISFDVTSFSGFFIHSTIYGYPLTTQFFTFTGRREGGTNVLTWTLPNEQNIRGYEMERSYDGQNFTPIGFVNSTAPAGNSAAPLQYHFTDNNFTGDKQYYRTRQTALDGSVKISPVVLIKSIIKASLTLSGVFPNPAGSFVNAIIESPVHNDLTIILSDISGRVLQTRKIIVEKGTTVIPFNTEQLAGGTYLMKIICDNGCENAVQKFVKQ